MTEYKARIVDSLLKSKLKGKDATLMERSKWFGKTTTMSNANSVLEV